MFFHMVILSCLIQILNFNEWVSHRGELGNMLSPVMPIADVRASCVTKRDFGIEQSRGRRSSKET